MKERGKNQLKWLLWWGHTGAEGNPNIPFDDLRFRYDEPHRAYHVMSHIEQCLEEFSEARRLAVNRYAVELAIWYHDAVYDPQSNVNEVRSAMLAKIMMQHAQLSEGFQQAVADLILATKHTVPPVHPDAQLLVDIDLSILGQSQEKFEEYEKQIRKEYAWVPRKVFARKRARILRRIAARRPIYSTDFFRKKYEAQAKRNLARSITRLEA
jgi:predicted metal-dependent HD superfamily phosphohydrolase